MHSIALSIPISTLQKSNQPASAANTLDGNYVIGVWASASRPAMRTPNGSTLGSHPQVARLGMPLLNETITPIGAKDAWSRTTPYSEKGLSVAESSPYRYQPRQCEALAAGASQLSLARSP